MKNIFLLLFLIATIPLNAQIIHDDSYLDQDFWKFKVGLEKCVLDKDAKVLKNYLADTIFESHFGCPPPGCSKNDFVEMLFEDSSPYWKELERILRFGFRRLIDEDPTRIIPHDKVIFQAPYYYTDLDEEKELIILGENVNIRSKPSLKGTVIHKASYEKFDCNRSIVTMQESTVQNIDGIDWIEITLKNGNTGYVAMKLTSYDLSKELTVAKVNGEWKIISFYNPPGC